MVAPGEYVVAHGYFVRTSSDPIQRRWHADREVDAITRVAAVDGDMVTVQFAAGNTYELDIRDLSLNPSLQQIGIFNRMAAERAR